MFTYRCIVFLACMHQLIAAFPHPLYERLEPNHAYAPEKQDRVICDIQNSQFFHDVLTCDFDVYAKKYDITPERIIERIDAENEYLSDDEIIRYVKYRLACRLQSRFAHLNTYGKPDISDTYLQFWMKHQAKADTCDAMIEHIVHAFCNHEICIEDDSTYDGYVCREEREDNHTFTVSLFLKRQIARIASQLFHVVEHEITHLEQCIHQYVIYTPGSNTIRPLYANHPLKLLNTSPRSDSDEHQLESEADYMAAMRRPLAQYFTQEIGDKANVIPEHIGSNLTYLTGREYRDLLLYTRSVVSPTEQHRQKMLAYNIRPHMCHRASRSATHAACFVAYLVASVAMQKKRCKPYVRRISIALISFVHMLLSATYPHIIQKPYNSYCIHNPHTWSAHVAITCDRIITKLINTSEDTLSHIINKVLSDTRKCVSRN